MLLSVFTAYFMLLFEISHSKKLKNKTVKEIYHYCVFMKLTSKLTQVCSEQPGSGVSSLAFPLGEECNF